MTLRVPLKVAGWRVVLSLGAGIALACAFPNYNLAPLGWVSLGVLMAALLDAELGEAALCGICYGAGFYALSLTWVYTVLRQYGQLPVWQGIGVLILLVIAESLYCVVFAVAVAWMAKRSAGLALVSAPFFWVALELARSHFPANGFPWNLLGYTAAGSLPLVQITSLTGVYGLSLFVAAYNAAGAWMVRALLWPVPNRLRRRPAATWLGLTATLLIVVLFGGRFVPVAQPTGVAHLVQINLPQYVEYPANWDAMHASDMAELDRIAIEAGKTHPGLIVWPEAPAPFSLQDAPFARRAASVARESQSYFILGVLNWERQPSGSPAPFNSAVMLDPAGRQEFLYDKINLLPFGEYIPWRRYLWFAKGLTGLVGDFHFGTHYVIGQLPGGRFAVFICYEAVYPDEVRRFALHGAELLINISDDGWFGRTAGPTQHLAMARVRAVENRRWLLRDTNNGITVSVDPYGRMMARLPSDVRAELDAPYGFRGNLTLYTRWGDWVAWLAIVISVLLLVVGSLVRKGRPVRRGDDKNKQE